MLKIFLSKRSGPDPVQIFRIRPCPKIPETTGSDQIRIRIHNTAIKWGIREMFTTTKLSCCSVKKILKTKVSNLVWGTSWSRFLRWVSHLWREPDSCAWDRTPGGWCTPLASCRYQKVKTLHPCLVTAIQKKARGSRFNKFKGDALRKFWAQDRGRCLRFYVG